jgi:hypothetical protein
MMGGLGGPPLAGYGGYQGGMQSKANISSYATAGGGSGLSGVSIGQNPAGFAKPSIGQGMSALNSNMQGLSLSSQNSHEGSPVGGMSPSAPSGLSAPPSLDPRLMGPPAMNLRQGAEHPNGQGRQGADYSDYGYGDRS